MQLKEAFDKAVVFFKEKGFSSPRLDAELLFSHALKIERIKIYTDFEKPLSELDLESCRQLLRRRAQGESVAYILGKKDFFGRSFAVGPGVLVPRPETEILVETVLQKNISSAVGLELGVGSGCISLTLAIEIEDLKMYGFDCSDQALTYAQQNLKTHELTERVHFYKGNADRCAECTKLLPQNIKFDFIVANPPYISVDDKNIDEAVKKFEPHEALFAQEQGLYALKRWTEQWLPTLKDEGFIVYEIGYDQGLIMQKYFTEIGLKNVHVVKDLAGHHRVIRGEKNG